MNIRIRTPSLIRLRESVDRTVLKESRALVGRRGALRGALTLGALTTLTGCDVSEEASVQKGLRAVSSWNDAAQAVIFRPDHLAQTFSPSEVLKPPRFNAYYPVEDVRPIDGRTWKLELAGLIKDKRPWTAQQNLSIAGAGIDHPPHLRGRLGLHRAMVRAELARFSHPDRGRPTGKICLFHLQ
jgi:hypothetical protein